MNHKFIQKEIPEYLYKNIRYAILKTDVYKICENCKFAYITSNTIKIHDLFLIEDGYKLFDLTCEEVIIKKILE